MCWLLTVIVALSFVAPAAIRAEDPQNPEVDRPKTEKELADSRKLSKLTKFLTYQSAVGNTSALAQKWRSVLGNRSYGIEAPFHKALPPKMRADADLLNNTHYIGLSGGGFHKLLDAMVKEDGVLRAMKGYLGGWMRNPTYEEVSLGRTGHAEGVLVLYDARRTDLDTLLRAFWAAHDASRRARYRDVELKYVKGTQFRSSIYTASAAVAAKVGIIRKEVAKERSITIATRVARFRKVFYVEFRPRSDLLLARRTVAATLSTILRSFDGVEIKPMLRQPETIKFGEMRDTFAPGVGEVKPKTDKPVSTAALMNDIVVIDLDRDAGVYRTKKDVRSIIKQVNTETDRDVAKAHDDAKNELLAKNTPAPEV